MNAKDDSYNNCCKNIYETLSKKITIFILYKLFYKREPLSTINYLYDKLGYGGLYTQRKQMVTNAYMLKNFFDTLLLNDYKSILTEMVNIMNIEIKRKIKNLMEIDDMLLGLAYILHKNKIRTAEKVSNLNVVDLYSYLLCSKNRSLLDINRNDSLILTGVYIEKKLKKVDEKQKINNDIINNNEDINDIQRCINIINNAKIIHQKIINEQNNLNNKINQGTATLRDYDDYEENEDRLNNDYEEDEEDDNNYIGNA